MTTPIDNHEGAKYLRWIHPALVETDSDRVIRVDVYSVLEAFEVMCPARQHAIKKLLCAGLRGKGKELDDLVGVLAAVNRAIELQKQREETTKITPAFRDGKIGEVLCDKYRDERDD